MFKPSLNFIFPQWFAGLAVGLMMMELGFMGGSISPIMIKLMAPNSSIQLNSDEISWFASLINAGRLCGALMGAIGTAYLGTKGTIFATIIPIALGWLGIALANTVEILYAARVSSGIGIGMAMASFPLYLGEIAIPSIRGSLVSFASSFGVSFGQALASVASTYLSLTGSISIYLGICLFLMAVFFFLPESPHHLVKVGNQKAAKKSISWYRSGRGVDEEFIAVEKFVESESTITFIDRLREFKNPGIRRATCQVIILYAFMQINGLNSILYYLEVILRKAQFNLTSSSEMVIYINVCGAVASIVSIFLIDKCGRKFLLILSSSGVTISLVMMASHFLLIDMNIDVKNLQWLPALSMMMYSVFFYIGMMSVPSAIMSETIPANVKCLVGCLGSFSAGTFSFISTKAYQPMVDSMGETYVFFIYALLTVIVIPYTIFVMKETKGKSLQQIQDELMKK